MRKQERGPHRGARRERAGNGTSRSPEDRHTFSLDVVRSVGEVDVARVAEELAVSQMTVRRDLAHLDKVGLLRRVHGGATVRDTPARRSEVMPSEKSRIGAAIAELVPPGDVVGIDVGSTCTAVAVQLALREDVTAVTNSLHAALPFQFSRSQLILLGGVLTQEGSFVDGGPLDQRRNIHLNTLVLGCGGVSAEFGITYFDLAETALREDLVERSDTVILAADHSKFDIVRQVRLGGFETIDVLVTSAPPPAQEARALEAASVQVVIAD